MTEVGICSKCERPLELTSEFGPDGTGPAHTEAVCECGQSNIPPEFFTVAAGGQQGQSTEPRP